MIRARKSSLRVSLVLIGVATLAGCGEEGERRDVYASREDCLADWGRKPEDCTPATDPSHASRHFWYGPSHTYSPWFGTGSHARGSHAVGSSASHVSRGGFGASGRGGG